MECGMPAGTSHISPGLRSSTPGGYPRAAQLEAASFQRAKTRYYVCAHLHHQRIFTPRTAGVDVLLPSRIATLNASTGRRSGPTRILWILMASGSIGPSGLTLELHVS